MINFFNFKQIAGSETLLLEYYELLKRLNIMMKTKYEELFDNVTEILSTLEVQFLQRPYLQDFITANKCFIGKLHVQRSL